MKALKLFTLIFLSAMIVDTAGAQMKTRHHKTHKSVKKEHKKAEKELKKEEKREKRNGMIANLK